MLFQSFLPGCCLVAGCPGPRFHHARRRQGGPGSEYRVDTVAMVEMLTMIVMRRGEDEGRVGVATLWSLKHPRPMITATHALLKLHPE